MSDIRSYEPLWDTWYIDSFIGEGTYGKVYKVRREEDGDVHYSVVKIISIPYDEEATQQMRAAGFSETSLRDFSQILVSNIVQEIKQINDPDDNDDSNAFVNYKDIKVIEKTGEIGWDILLRMDFYANLFEHSEKTPLSHTEVVKLGLDICEALEQCAQKNTVHLNIKPENIFISPSGRYLLGDIGIAPQIELTINGLATRAACTYMVPELYHGTPYDETNVDTYALGILLYCLLNKYRAPFLPDYPKPVMPQDRDEAMERRVNGEPLPNLKGVSPELNAIVLTACAYDLEERFESPAAMYLALSALTEQEFRPLHEETQGADAPDLDKKDLDDDNYYDLFGDSPEDTAAIAADTRHRNPDPSRTGQLQADGSLEDTQRHDIRQTDMSQEAALTMQPTRKHGSKPLTAALVVILALIGVCGFVFANYLMSDENEVVSADKSGKSYDLPRVTDETATEGNEDAAEDEPASNPENDKKDGTDSANTASQPSQDMDVSVPGNEGSANTPAQPSSPQGTKVFDNKNLYDSGLDGMITNGEIPRNTTELSLRNTKLLLGNEGLINRLAASLPNLKRLDLSSNNISSASQAKLRAALPNCTIIF